ncbi:MAG TPA: TusE/DsrC/DsvC family sulfur relay protein [Balneolaceae bacterium]|nr:TusE/DsrC/DsvC family sulfur relay protein [Balneolaceae bacterium]
MSTATIAQKTIEVDQEGFMKDHTQWNEDIARELAKLEGIDELTDRHWKIIRLMRKEYDEKGDGPSIRRLTKESGVPIKELYQLFPKGPAKKAAKIAGIPKPTGCI